MKKIGIYSIAEHTLTRCFEFHLHEWPTPEHIAIVAKPFLRTDAELYLLIDDAWHLMSTDLSIVAIDGLPIAPLLEPFTDKRKISDLEEQLICAKEEMDDCETQIVDLEDKLSKLENDRFSYSLDGLANRLTRFIEQETADEEQHISDSFDQHLAEVT